MKKHEDPVQKWIVNRLNLTEPIDEMWAKRIIDEMITNDYEQRYTPYQELTDEEWIKLYNYLSDYAYVYLFGTDSINKILASELFKFIISRFDGRAQAMLGQTSKANEFMKNRKYTFLPGRGTEIPMIF